MVVWCQGVDATVYVEATCLRSSWGLDGRATGGLCSDPQSPRVGTECLCHF